jgi:hypothetical protein
MASAAAAAGPSTVDMDIVPAVISTCVVSASPGVVDETGKPQAEWPMMGALGSSNWRNCYC